MLCAEWLAAAPMPAAEWLEDLGEHEMVPVVRSHKLCLLAEGEARVYPRLGPSSAWDTGAA